MDRDQNKPNSSVLHGVSSADEIIYVYNCVYLKPRSISTDLGNPVVAILAATKLRQLSAIDPHFLDLGTSWK
jgi:hypothetical protein